MIGWSDDALQRAVFVRTVHRILELKRNLLVFEEAEFPVAQLERRIDVWWRAKENGSLMLTLAHLIQDAPRYREHSIRVLRIIEDEAGRQPDRGRHAPAPDGCADQRRGGDLSSRASRAMSVDRARLGVCRPCALSDSPCGRWPSRRIRSPPSQHWSPRSRETSSSPRAGTTSNYDQAMKPQRQPRPKRCPSRVRLNSGQLARGTAWPRAIWTWIRRPQHASAESLLAVLRTLGVTGRTSR